VDTTYTNLRQNLSSILDDVVDQQEIVIVRRKSSRDVALVPARELAGLIETAHLLRSPRNAKRLLSALGRAEKRAGRPSTVARIRQETLGDA
jgi:antitoxin YefM